ncbi:DnaJ domain-containing protein [Haliangium sp.]|uniref:DnaJ domain-containing protein n=1 Tax=Haliangium sp. TaxID=2663208 RepID=UPI003D0E9443
MRTLKVRCPTWRHVEAFYSRKLRKDRTLTLRVPFHPEPQDRISLGLELPDGDLIAIDGTVLDVSAPEGGRAAIRLFLHGLDSELLGRLKARVAGAAEPQPATVPAPIAPSTAEPELVPEPPTPTSISTRFPVPPVSRPDDAPVDERIEPPVVPVAEDVSEYERDVFLYLEGELKRLRECAAHEVLAVAAEADPAAVRRAYFELTKNFHPDLFARFRSPAINYMAQELFIHINKAYDRMRDALVLAGAAIMAGPALIPQDGWMIGFDDLEAAAPDGETRVRAPSNDWGESDAAAPSAESEILSLLGASRFEEAREHVAAALHFDPRNRRMRALYHVISGRELMAAGEDMAAVTQFDAALAHDRDCNEAHEALEALRARGQHDGIPPRTMR